MNRFSYPLTLSLAIALFLQFTLAAAPTMAQKPDPDRRTVSVTGEGMVTVAPDRAVVQFGVVTTGETAEMARRQNAEIASASTNAVRELGIDEESIQMESLRLQPKEEYDPKAEIWREEGFEATRQVRVVVETLNLLPDIVTQAVQAGANRVESVRYDLTDPSTARNDALEKAARNARSKAERLARTLEVGLSPVRQIDEQNVSFPQPEMIQFSMERNQADTPPEPDAYAAGEIDVRAQVRVVFDLGGDG